METVGKLNQNRKLFAVVLGVTGAFLFLLNTLTPYIADDYAYMISFYNQQWIKNLWDVARSMYQHSLTINGRVLPHALEQIFLLMPKAVFNVVSSAVLTAMFYGMYRLTNRTGKTNIALFLGMAIAFWLCLPAYGQVMLWQVGALNYGWSLAAWLLFMAPFINQFMDGKTIEKPWLKVLFTVGSVLFGLYSEVTSFIGIFTAALLLLTGWLVNGRRVDKKGAWLLLPWGGACVGYVLLMMMPAELAAKQGSLELRAIFQNIAAVTQKMEEHQLALLVVWACVILLGVGLGVNSRRLLLSLILTVGGLGANYMLIVARYIAERCFCTSTMLFVMAIGVVIPGLLQTERLPLRLGLLCGSGVLAGLFLFSAFPAVFDVYNTNYQHQENVAEILAAKERGDEEAVVDVVKPYTKYSGFWGIWYLDTTERNTFPNNYMGTYYGIWILGR